MTERPLTVALPWHTLRHGNLGVDALTRSNIEIVRAAGQRIGRKVEMITLCSNVGTSDLPDNVTVGPVPRLKPLLYGKSEFLATLRRCDLVLDIGEGDSWADIYGKERLAFHTGTKIAGLLLGKPLVFAPQTIGPFNGSFARRISNWVMNRSRAVFTRDDLSTAYVKAQNLQCETAEYIDVAFRLPFTRQPKKAGAMRVGLNVSGLLYLGGHTGKNELGMVMDYVDYTHRLIAALLERGAEVHLVPHVTAPDGNDDDWSVIPALRKLFPQIQVPERFIDASAAKSFMSGMDFVTGGRMHACIGAFSAGVAVAPLAYSRKFNGLFNTLGYPHFIDGRAVDTDTALEQTLSCFDRREQLAQDILPGLELARTRLDAYEAKLATLLAEVG